METDFSDAETFVQKMKKAQPKLGSRCCQVPSNRKAQLPVTKIITKQPKAIMAEERKAILHTLRALNSQSS